MNVTTGDSRKDLEYNDISTETRVLVENFCFAGLTLLMCLVGIPTNTISCLVFWRQGLQDRMNLCLFSLALADCLHLLCSFTIFPLSSFLHWYDKNLGEEYYLKSLNSLISLFHGFRSTAGFIGMVIALERCVCVVIPFRASTLIRTRTMAVILLFSLVFFQLSYLTYPFKLDASWVMGHDGEQWKLVITDFYEENFFLVRSYSDVIDIAVPVAILLTVVVTTTITIVKLRKAMKWRRKAMNFIGKNSDSHHAKLTIMLVINSVIYIVTMTPFMLWNIIFQFLEDPFRAQYNIFMVCKAISYTLPTINSSVHVFVYFSRSSRFRTELRRLCCRP